MPHYTGETRAQEGEGEERMSDKTTREQWRIWAQPPEVGCIWKDFLPAGAVAIETNLTVGACGEVVAATPTRERAEQVIRAVNAFEPMRAVLRQIEWCINVRGFGPTCPCCGCGDQEGHDNDCDMAAALRAADETTEGR